MKKVPMRFHGTKWYAFGTLRTRLFVSLALLVTLATVGFLVFRPAAAASPNFNNEGISNDGATPSANLDGVGFSYSNQALQVDGFNPGANVLVNGISFPWPAVTAGTPDNWQAAGQTVSLDASGATILGFLGSATHGPSSGTATLTYTDNSTQTFTLAFSDWTLNGGSASVLPADSIAATMTYRNTSTGAKQVKNTYIFFTSVALAAGKTLQSVTLPSTVNQGALHVFAVGTATPPTSQFNNEGISNDGAATSANFDGVGFSYSNQALKASGFNPGANVVVNGISFPWPNVAAGTPDNWQAGGQTIPFTASGAAILGFLGSATHGPSSGTVTLTYTDNSTQTFTLTFSDWTLNGGSASVAPADNIAATMSYRNTSSGARNTKKTYIFFTSVALTAGKTLQSVTLPVSANQGALHVFALGTTAGPQGSATVPTYMGDNTRSGFNGSETAITPQSVAGLKRLWTVHSTSISMQPIVANNLIYWGSWDGFEHATNFAGTEVWRTNLGTNTDNNCQPPEVGIASSATVTTLNGTPTVFVGGGNANMYALNANTGAILWQRNLGSLPAHFLYDSPLVYNGSVYMGVSSFGDCPLVQGQVFQLNETTGAVQHVINTVPNGCNGGGVWGSPTLDATLGLIYFDTGTPPPGLCAGKMWSPQVIAVHASDLSPAGLWSIPLSQVGGDTDFGATPTLFTATINGTQRQLVGLMNKNGIYYAFDRTNISAGPVWEKQVSGDASCQNCDNGVFSPSAWDGTTLYAASGSTTINATCTGGNVRALDPATGKALWTTCLPSRVIAAVTAVPGLVVVEGGSTLTVLASATGKVLFTFHDTTTGAIFDGPATIVNGVLYVGNIDGNLYAFTV